MNARILCAAPLVAVVDEFATAQELAALRQWFEDPVRRANTVDSEHRDTTGHSLELPLSAEPAAAAVTQRIEALVGWDDAWRLPDGGTLRLRQYQPGESHPRHGDAYYTDEGYLAVTAMLVLDAPAAGGETLLPAAVPGPLRLQPQPGRLFLWRNCTEAADEDPAAAHLALAVRQGVKTTATRFLYAPIDATLDNWPLPMAPAVERRDAHLATAAGLGGPLRGLGRRLVVVDDEVPPETLFALTDAADRRGVAVVTVDAPSFDYAPQRRLRAADLLYRPAVSQVAARVEQFLGSPGPADLYTRPRGVFFDPDHASNLPGSVSPCTELICGRLPGVPWRFGALWEPGPRRAPPRRQTRIGSLKARRRCDNAVKRTARKLRNPSSCVLRCRLPGRLMGAKPTHNPTTDEFVGSWRRNHHCGFTTAAADVLVAEQAEAVALITGGRDADFDAVALSKF